MKGRYVMIKKLISAIAAAAIATTAFASLASAEKTYDIRLDTGVTQSTGVGTGNRQYFTVKCDDLAGEYTSAIQIQIKVISGSLESFTMVKGTDKKGGLYVVEEGEDEETGDPIEVNTYLAASGWTKNLSTDDEGNQLIKFSWGSSTPYISNGGIIAELYVVATDPTADVELELVNGVDDAGGALTRVNTCTSDNSNKVVHGFTPEVAPQYVLAAGTSTITEKSTGDTGSTKTDATPGTVFNETGSAKASTFTVTSTPTTGATKAYWYAKIGGEDKRALANIPALDGGEVMLGLVFHSDLTIENVQLGWE